MDRIHNVINSVVDLCCGDSWIFIICRYTDYDKTVEVVKNNRKWDHVSVVDDSETLLMHGQDGIHVIKFPKYLEYLEEENFHRKYDDALLII